MIETKLLVDRILDYRRPGSRKLTGIPPAFIDVICPPLAINESTRKDPGAIFNPLRNVGGVRTSTVGIGANTNPKKVHRNFKWLPWYEGDISATTLDHDVITGPMSGCVLVTYRDNGVRKAGHIGTVTVTENSPATINTNVKAVWTNFATAHPHDVIGGFCPTAIPQVHPPARGDDIAGETWGLLTTNGEYYSVLIYIQKGMTSVRIAAIHQVQSMSLHALQHI